MDISLQDILAEMPPEYVEVRLADDPDDPQFPGLEGFALKMRIPDPHVREKVENTYFGVDPVQRQGRLHLDPKTDHCGYLHALSTYMVDWSGVYEAFDPELLWALCRRFPAFAPTLANGVRAAFEAADKTQILSGLNKKKSPDMPAGKTPAAPMNV